MDRRRRRWGWTESGRKRRWRWEQRKCEREIGGALRKEVNGVAVWREGECFEDRKRERVEGEEERRLR